MRFIIWTFVSLFNVSSYNLCLYPYFHICSRPLLFFINPNLQYIKPLMILVKALILFTTYLIFYFIRFPLLDPSFVVNIVNLLYTARFKGFTCRYILLDRQKMKKRRQRLNLQISRKVYERKILCFKLSW